MKRRDFVSMLIGASTAAILVPKRVFSLPEPPRDFTTADMTVNNYFTSPHAWYLKTEHPDGLALYSRAHPISLPYPGDYLIEFSDGSEGMALSEASIEKLCIDIRKLTDDRDIALTFKSTHRIVSPIEYHYLMSEGQ